MAKSVYVDVISAIHNKRFNLTNVPVHYVEGTNPIVKDSLGRVVEPIYNPELTETTSWYATLIDIVDMEFQEIPFRIASDEEAFAIKDLIENYGHFLKSKGTIPDDHKVFVERLSPFADHMERMCRKLRGHALERGDREMSFLEAMQSHME